MVFAYKTQILFALIFGALVYLGLQKDGTSTLNIKRGILAAALILIAQGCLTQSNGPFIQRLEVLWKGASRYTLVYLSALVFIFYQTEPDARQLLKYFNPNLKSSRPIDPYFDTACDFSFFDMDNLDKYYFSCLLGWFVATLMIRDKYFLFFWNLLGLILQSPRRQIFNWPYICWEADIFLYAVCGKGLAITIGMRLIRKLGLREFDWFGRQGKSSIKEWDIFHNHKRFGNLCFLYFISNADDCTGFMITDTLYVHGFNTYINSVWFTLCTMTLGEIRDDMETWGTEKRKQTPIRNESRWIICGVTILQIAICWKFGAIGKFLERHAWLFEYSLPWYFITHGVEEVWKNLSFISYTSPAWIWAQSFPILILYYLYLRLKKGLVAKDGDGLTTPASDINKHAVSEEINKTEQNTEKSQRDVLKKKKNGSNEEKADLRTKVGQKVEAVRTQAEVTKSRKKLNKIKL